MDLCEGPKNAVERRIRFPRFQIAEKRRPTWPDAVFPLIDRLYYNNYFYFFISLSDTTIIRAEKKGSLLVKIQYAMIQ